MRDQQLSELLMTLGHALLSMARGLETDVSPHDLDKQPAPAPAPEEVNAKPEPKPAPATSASFVQEVRQIVQETGGRAAPAIQSLLAQYAPPGGGVSSVPTEVQRQFVTNLRAAMSLTPGEQ